MSNAKFILGLESAIAGGSLAILADGQEVASWTATGDSPKGEALLSEIDQMLRASDISLSDLQTIAISTGPGSFTGLRIGMATALGLSAALKIRCLGLTALQAMAASSEASVTVAIVPVGRDMAAAQSFSDGVEDAPPMVLPMSDITELIAHRDITSILAHQSIVSVLPADLSHKVITIDNIASLVARSGKSRYITEDLRPLFVDTRSFTKIKL